MRWLVGEGRWWSEDDLDVRGHMVGARGGEGGVRRRSWLVTETWEAHCITTPTSSQSPSPPNSLATCCTTRCYHCKLYHALAHLVPTLTRTRTPAPLHPCPRLCDCRREGRRHEAGLLQKDLQYMIESNATTPEGVYAPSSSSNASSLRAAPSSSQPPSSSSQP